MGHLAALLAAVLCGLAVAGCGDGAEPGAPDGATLVLDFQPNAVHAGIYAARERGYFADEGLDLEIREPSGSADSAKLLEAGRADFAVMDVNDFGIARERGLDIAAIAAVVQRPLAAVIAADRDAVRSRVDLEGRTVGVTGVPSDDAVLDTVLRSAGVAPASVRRETVGFQAVPLLAAGRLDAATAFWNAEGVALAEEGVPVREFRVDEFGAPRYPELVIATDTATAGSEDGRACRLERALGRAYREMQDEPGEALADLLEANEELDADAQEAQMDALLDAGAFSEQPDQPVARPRLSFGRVRAWSGWALAHGLIEDRREVLRGFAGARGC